MAMSTRNQKQTEISTNTPTKDSHTSSRLTKLIDHALTSETSLKEIINLLKLYETRIANLENAKADIPCPNCESYKNSITALQNEISGIGTMLTDDKRQRHLEVECKKIRSEMDQFWSHKLNKRKMTWWHYVQNLRKAELYVSWKTESPMYIPLKFRPKTIRGECEMATKVRIDQAREQYHKSIDLHRAYADSHLEKCDYIDNEVKVYIKSLTSDTETFDMISNWWTRDISNNEEFSTQKWTKNEQFLNMKKREDIDNSNVEITDSPWYSQKQKPYNRNNNSPRNSNNNRSSGAAQGPRYQSRNMYNDNRNIRRDYRDSNNSRNQTNPNRGNFNAQSRFTNNSNSYNVPQSNVTYSPSYNNSGNRSDHNNTYHSNGSNNYRSNTEVQHSPRGSSYNNNSGNNSFRMNTWGRYPN